MSNGTLLYRKAKRGACCDVCFHTAGIDELTVEQRATLPKDKAEAVEARYWYTYNSSGYMDWYEAVRDGYEFVPLCEAHMDGVLHLAESMGWNMTQLVSPWEPQPRKEQKEASDVAAE